ncbi:MAG TPA: cytochrome P450 [Solirubrobacteraceae bacterium]|nr:cytochrome P450 [Solirubrobacteraceae bacterium]
MTLPPGPTAPPLVQTFRFGLDPLGFLENAWREHGDVFSIRLAHEGHWAVVASPSIAAEVFRAPPEVSRAGEANAFLRPVLGGGSVLLADGEEHLAKRRFAVRLLDPPDVARIAARHLATWRSGERVRVLPRMQALTLDVILEATLGNAQKAADVGRAVRRMLRFATRRSTMLGVALLGYRAAALNPVLRAHLWAVRGAIRDHVHDRDAADQILTLIVAGHDTTASQLSWAIDQLARDRPALERVRAGDEEFLDAVVKETLRLRPTVPLVARRLAAPLTVGGWDLPAGTGVAPAMLLIQRRPDVFDEPDRFRPERWLEDDAGARAAWVPFGGGTRRCLGASLATTTISAVLAELAQVADLEPSRPDPPRIGRRAHTLVPEPAEVRVVRRSGRPAARPHAARAG